MDNYVIAVARGFGSGGKAIGTQLAKELGISCYAQQLLDMASDYSGKIGRAQRLNSSH